MSNKFLTFLREKAIANKGKPKESLFPLNTREDDFDRDLITGFITDDEAKEALNQMKDFDIDTLNELFRQLMWQEKMTLLHDHPDFDSVRDSLFKFMYDNKCHHKDAAGTIEGKMAFVKQYPEYLEMFANEFGSWTEFAEWLQEEDFSPERADPVLQALLPEIIKQAEIENTSANEMARSEIPESQTKNLDSAVEQAAEVEANSQPAGINQADFQSMKDKLASLRDDAEAEKIPVIPPNARF